MVQTEEGRKHNPSFLEQVGILLSLPPGVASGSV
jgi:hypothetical protein